MEISSTKSNVLKSIDSNDISISDLELLANKKKLQVSESKSKSKSKSRVKKDTSTVSMSSSDAYRSEDTHKKTKRIDKENSNEKTRTLKNKLLYEISNLNKSGNLSNLKLTMNSSLDEIKLEHTRITTNKQGDIAVNLCKKGLLLAVQGFEWANHNYDPLGIDLDGWGQSLNYSMENQEFDEVLRELYDKYKGESTWSPEFRLLSLLVSSAVMFNINKRISSTNLSDGLLGNILGKLSSKPPQPSPPPPQREPQREQPQREQPQQQRRPPVPMQTQPTRPNSIPQPVYNPQYDEAELSDNTSDSPSKLNAPMEDDLNDIIKRMNANKVELESINIFDESEKPVTEKVINVKKRGRGRPKKQI